MKKIVSVQAVPSDRGLTPLERMAIDGRVAEGRFVSPKYLVTIVYEVDEAGLEELKAFMPESMRQVRR